MGPNSYFKNAICDTTSGNTKSSHIKIVADPQLGEHLHASIFSNGYIFAIGILSLPYLILPYPPRQGLGIFFCQALLP